MLLIPFVEQLPKVHLENWKMIFTHVLPKDLQFIYSLFSLNCSHGLGTGILNNLLNRD